MRKIRCLIADDEPMALSLIESYVLKTPFLELVKKCNNAIEAMQVLENGEEIDLFFWIFRCPNCRELNFLNSSQRPVK